MIWNSFIGWLAFLLVTTNKQNIIAALEQQLMDETRAPDVIGWTDAHNAVYGRIDNVSSDDIASFLASASNDYLCIQNDFGQTALHLAVRQNVLPVVQIYVDRKLCLDLPNKDGDTPLHYGAFWDRPEAVALLLRGGADKDVLNSKGHTALDDAESVAKSAVVQLLVDTAN